MASGLEGVVERPRSLRDYHSVDTSGGAAIGVRVPQKALIVPHRQLSFGHTQTCFQSTSEKFDSYFDYFQARIMRSCIDFIMRTSGGAANIGF